MERRYKVIISNKNIYKEIELNAEARSIKVGTGVDCDVRLRKDLFFEQIELLFISNGENWSVLCSDNLYLTVGDIRKLITKNLTHGDSLVVKYQESNSDVFTLDFMIDFDYEQAEYDLKIDISNKSQIVIGEVDGADIFFENELSAQDFLTLKKIADGKLELVDNGTRYGVYLNGVKISEKAKVYDYDFFSINGFSFYYKNNELYTSSSKKMAIRGMKNERTENHMSCFKYPHFNRNTRIQYVIPSEEIEIQQAAQKPQRPKKNIVMSLIPSIVMLAMTVVLRGIMGGGGSFVIYSAISMSMGIIMSVVSFVQEGKEYKKTYQERIDTYNKYIDEKISLIEKARTDELRVRNEIYKSLDNSVQEAMQFGEDLFEKQHEDEDFLKIYLGKGRIESAAPIKYTKQEFVDLEDPLATLPKEISEKYQYIDSAPIVSDFKNSNGVGFVGKKEYLQEILKNITLDISIRHFYNEIKLVYLLDEQYVSKLEWIKWLHNVENQKLGVKNIVCDEESKNVILEDLYVTLSTRENMVNQAQKASYNEHYVVFVTDSSAISTHPVSKYFQNSNAYGFTFVFLEEYEENIPQGCGEIIRIKDNQHGVLVQTENGDIQQEFSFPYVNDDVAKYVALKLGAVTVDEVSLEGELTKNITMYEMLGILSVDDIDLEQRWAEAKVYKSLAAPLGVKTKNQTVYLDISDKGKAHGPHGLVAGTTGSGKSEVLQTYILSMATLYHPYEVGFVVIDFKGGGMANQFKDLPHLIGTITNIDGREINRSLLSIKAELVKRQEMFSESGVNHINDYIRLYKAGKVSTPLPHLIMIVDEFAELKAEYPDFMKELISAARIGRTLGIHLILATQKPAGVVDAQIWSNSKFKLCLKVQTKEDSNEVIKTPLAAEIVEPGRAYFQVGNNEIFELFQSAYSGANVPEGNENNENIYQINECNIWGKRTLKYTNKKTKTEKNSVTQLQAIVDYIHDYCANENIQKLPGICLPSLKDHINTDELNYDLSEEPCISASIGWYDDPEQQNQDLVDIDVSRNNVYIVGSAQSGKTVMLQTLLYGLIRKYTPQQVNLYLIDCGSMVLKIFEDSAHVGGVVLSNEDEKCKNLFKLLNSFITQRKKVLSSKGIGNYSSYIEAGFTDIPMVVVAIDNLAAFKEYFPNQADELNSLSREAQSVGISFVITAPTANAMNYRTQSNFGKKFVLNCNDANEYSNVLGHCRVTPKENPGRGLLMHEKRILEYQVAMFGKDKKEANRSQELKDYISQRNTECTTKAVKIPMIPEKLSLSNMMVEDVQAFRNKGILPLGMDFSTVSLASINLSHTGTLSLLGDVESRTTFTNNLMKMISRTAIFHGIEAYVVDDKAQKLNECNSYGFVRKYSSNLADGLAMVADFCDDVMDRCEEDDNDTQIMLLINSNEVFKKICSDKKESKQLSDAMKNAVEAGAFILVVGVDNQTVGFNSSEVLKTIKEQREAILFAQLTESKLFDVSARLKNDPSFDNSVGYWFSGASYSKIKIFD